MHKRFSKISLAGALIGALAISILPAESAMASPVYGADESALFLDEEITDENDPGETIPDYGEADDELEIESETIFYEDDENASGGIIPVHWNMPEEETEVTLNMFTEELVGASDLPSTYINEVRTGIRSQRADSCWVHSLTTSAEMSMISAGLADEVDYSERQILYGYFNQTDGDKGLPTNGSWKLSRGNYLMATAAVSNHIGLGDESLYPSDDGMTELDIYNDISHIEKVLFLGSWPEKKSAWQGSAWTSMNESVKAAVFKYGTAAITYNSGPSHMNTDTFGFYSEWSSDTKPTADHSVTVIGWDDDMIVRDGVPEGAFYVQNSWGPNSYRTDHGYNWISYYDASLGTACVYVPEQESVGTLYDEDVYSHTGTGYSGKSLTNITKAANVFEAEKNETIDCIGVYADKASTCIVYVVTDLKDYSNPESGKVAASVSQDLEGAGFYKLYLPTGVTVRAGGKFAVILTMYGQNDGVYRIPFEGGSSSLRQTFCGRGESFIMRGGQYVDCAVGTVTIRTTDDAGNPVYTESSLKDNFGNICIYAYGNPAEEIPGPFPDVPYDHPYANAITWALERGITKGYSATGLFGIDDTCTRGQIMQFLWRYAGTPNPKTVSVSPFPDVPKNHPYYKAILWGSQKGITKGFKDGRFGIDEYCTRGQIMQFIWRYKGCPSPKSTVNPFTDTITPAYLKAVIWAYEKKITQGFSDGTYGDTRSCTRGQAVKFLHNLYLKT